MTEPKEEGRYPNALSLQRAIQEGRYPNALSPEIILTDAILPGQSRPQDEPSDEFGVLPLGDGRGGR